MVLLIKLNRRFLKGHSPRTQKFTTRSHHHLPASSLIHTLSSRGSFKGVQKYTVNDKKRVMNILQHIRSTHGEVTKDSHECEKGEE